MVRYDFDGKVAFVTGAARGQGRSHALRYAENGADVVVTDICETTPNSRYELADDTDLAETVEAVEERGARALGLRMDVSDAEEVDGAVERAVEEFGRVDILANNAGIAPISGLLDLDEETWDETFDVNLKGMWLCARRIAAEMAARGEGGRIVNTASTAAFLASPGLGHYTAAKHGVVGLTKSLAVELAPHDITVNAVCPTAVDTPMTGGIVETMEPELAELAEQKGTDTLFDEILQPEDVSAAFMWLSSDDARYVTGVALPVDAGALSL